MNEHISTLLSGALLSGESEAKGRNGWFKAHEVEVSGWRLTHEIGVNIRVLAKTSGSATPLAMSLTHADAVRLYDALGAVLQPLTAASDQQDD